MNYSIDQIQDYIDANTYDIDTNFKMKLAEGKILVGEFICGDGRHTETGKISIFGQSIGLLVASIVSAKDQYQLNNEIACKLYDYLIENAFDGHLSHHTHVSDPDNIRTCGHINQILTIENLDKYGLSEEIANHIGMNLISRMKDGNTDKIILEGGHAEELVIAETGDHMHAIAHQCSDTKIKQVFVYTNTELLNEICDVMDQHVITFLGEPTFSGTKQVLLHHTGLTATALAPDLESFEFDGERVK